MDMNYAGPANDPSANLDRLDGCETILMEAGQATFKVGI